MGPAAVPKERDFLTVDESERVVAALVGQEYELPILVAFAAVLRGQGAISAAAVVVIVLVVMTPLLA